MFASPITLTNPKSISSASVVGGLFTSFNDILPQYGIDISNKIFVPEGPDLFTYQYVGQINGLIHAGSEQAADQVIKRHAAAVELFIRRHQYAHSYEVAQFKLIEMLFNDIEMSGAEDLGMVDGKQMWLSAFSMNLFWWTSEDGPSQHG